MFGHFIQYRAVKLALKISLFMNIEFNSYLLRCNWTNHIEVFRFLSSRSQFLISRLVLLIVKHFSSLLVAITSNFSVQKSLYLKFCVILWEIGVLYKCEVRTTSLNRGNPTSLEKSVRNSYAWKMYEKCIWNVSEYENHTLTIYEKYKNCTCVKPQRIWNL